MLRVYDLHKLLARHNHPQFMPRPFFNCIKTLLKVHNLGFEGCVALAAPRPLLPKFGDAVIQTLEFPHIAFAVP